MNIKRIGIIMSVSILSLSAVGCGSNKYADTPMNEIKEAKLDTGYIQVNGALLRDGGYITVKDFLAKYGKQFDTSELDGDLKKEIGEDWFFTYYIYYGEKGCGLDISCAPPVSGSGTVEDAVIVKFTPNAGRSDEYNNNSWYSGELPKVLSQEQDIDFAKKLFEDNGLAYTEYNGRRNAGIEENFPITENAGKYTVNEGENYVIAVGAVQLNEPNLYGYTPIISCFYESYDQEGFGNYFRYLEVNYDEGKSFWRE